MDFFIYICRKILYMPKYINPFTDIGFKKIFGQEPSKPLLLDFLNNLLQEEREIIDISFLDKEQLPDIVEGRSVIFDILCKTSDDMNIIVEMQNREQPFFKKRSIYYTYKAIARQGEKGTKWNFKINSVYFVSFLNFRLDDIGKEFRTDVALMNIKSKELFSKDIRLIYLQLPYFNKSTDECENNFDRWIYVLKHMEALNRLPWVAQSPIFKRLAETAEICSLSAEERIKYDEAIQWYRDNAFLIEDAEEVGMQKGIKKATLDIAKKLKAIGTSSEDIQKATGLSMDEIENL